MRTACIIQARLGSTRLPAKVLLPLPTGRTVLEEVLFRCKQIPGVDVIVVAMPDAPESRILAGFIDKALAFPDSITDCSKPYAVVLGPEHDVLARYAKAAEAVNADVILRITSDCPLLDPEVCGELLKLRERTNAGFASNSWPARSYPVGYDCEVFTRDVLERANVALAYGVNADREHAGCGWMKRQPDIKAALLKAMVDRSSERITLDTLADYVHIWSVFEQKMREAA